jgi:glycosyltransferase involved in cell wall biosynthesis
LTSPAVSICVPVRNGSRWLNAALDSVFVQTYDDFELVVVDDASTDGTTELVRRRGDGRVRLEVNDTPLGPPANHNRCVELARGTLIKFLHHDDLLYPDCVRRMAAVFEQHDQVGLVFSRRDVLLEDENDASAILWRKTYGLLDENFSSLRPINSGRDLLDDYLPTLRGRYMNWIGEPSVVMLRRTSFDAVGLFNTRMVLSYDLEMWLRLDAAFDVGFIDEPLVAYRHHSHSWTSETARTATDWLDLLWLLEGLLQTPQLQSYGRLLHRLRRLELARTARRQVGRLLRRNWDLAPLRGYLGYRVAAARGRAPSVHR